jgi:hypothetical protein
MNTRSVATVTATGVVTIRRMRWISQDCEALRQEEGTCTFSRTSKVKLPQRKE